MSEEKLPGRLMDLREERMWTQGELSEHSGVSPATINKIENGHIERPRFSTVRKLARALEVSPGELWIGREGQVHETPKAGAPHEGAVTKRIRRDYPRFLMGQEEFDELVKDTGDDDGAAAEISAELRRAVADVEASRDECEPVPAATNGMSMEFINLLDNYMQKSNRMMLRKVLLRQPILEYA